MFSVDFATYQPLRSQHSPVISCLDSNRGLPPFWGLSFALPTTPHPFVSTRDTTSLVQLLRFSILFGGKLYKQLQVLEVAWKVTDWCIFCVNFIRVLAILGELCWLQFFKTIYLETSNVRFGSFFQNPVTIALHEYRHNYRDIAYVIVVVSYASANNLHFIRFFRFIRQEKTNCNNSHCTQKCCKHTW